jgi:hypothetical protein
LMPSGMLYLAEPTKAWTEDETRPGHLLQDQLESLGFEVVGEEHEALPVDPVTTPESYKYILFKCTKP